MDTVADYLEEKGLIVKRTPNAIVPIAFLEDLDNHFRFAKENDAVDTEVNRPNDVEGMTTTYPESTSDTREENKSSDNDGLLLTDPRGIAETDEDNGLPDNVRLIMADLARCHSMIITLESGSHVEKKGRKLKEECRNYLSRLVAAVQTHQEFSKPLIAFLDSLSNELLDLILKSRSTQKNPRAISQSSDLLVNVRNGYLSASYNMVVDEVLETIEVGWDNVRFGNGKIILDIGKQKPINCEQRQSRETYNLFRVAFIQRVPPLQVRLHSKYPPEVVETPEFNEVFQYLKIRDDIRLGSFTRCIDLVNFIRTSKINFQDTFLPKDRGPYIQYLVEKQSPDYRYVPVFEKAIDQEDAFLFTLKGNRIYIVWENTNDNTATYVFPVTENTYEKKIQSIYDYASSDIEYKRMRMHYGQSRDIIGVECRIINHNDLHQWKSAINALLR